MRKALSVVDSADVAPECTSGTALAMQSLCQSSTPGGCLFPRGGVFPFLSERRTPCVSLCRRCRMSIFSA